MILRDKSYTSLHKLLDPFGNLRCDTWVQRIPSNIN